jgi:hypothetical protein
LVSAVAKALHDTSRTFLSFSLRAIIAYSETIRR